MVEFGLNACFAKTGQFLLTDTIEYKFNNNCFLYQTYLKLFFYSGRRTRIRICLYKLEFKKCRLRQLEIYF